MCNFYIEQGAFWEGKGWDPPAPTFSLGDLQLRKPALVVQGDIDHDPLAQKNMKKPQEGAHHERKGDQCLWCRVSIRVWVGGFICSAWIWGWKPLWIQLFWTIVFLGAIAKRVRVDKENCDLGAHAWSLTMAWQGPRPAAAVALHKGAVDPCSSDYAGPTTWQWTKGKACSEF